MRSPRAFASRVFDWRLFFRTLPFQPVPLWILLNAVAGPLGRTFPYLSRAVCEGRLRLGLMESELTLYIIAGPTLATALFYLTLGRRRLEIRDHRRIADVTFALMLALSLYDGVVIGRRIRAQWPVLRPGLTAIRAACWP